uniref:Fibronectin type-III domain-containing protein n=1 Tax=Macrostomum lignano TaxID=282301 RepID=A0A1I8FBU1_9PLAT
TTGSPSVPLNVKATVMGRPYSGGQLDQTGTSACRSRTAAGRAFTKVELAEDATSIPDRPRLSLTRKRAPIQHDGASTAAVPAAPVHRLTAGQDRCHPGLTCRANFSMVATFVTRLRPPGTPPLRAAGGPHQGPVGSVLLTWRPPLLGAERRADWLQQCTTLLTAGQFNQPATPRLRRLKLLSTGLQAVQSVCVQVPHENQAVRRGPSHQLDSIYDGRMQTVCLCRSGEAAGAPEEAAAAARRQADGGQGGASLIGQEAGSQSAHPARRELAAALLISTGGGQHQLQHQPTDARPLPPSENCLELHGILPQAGRGADGACGRVRAGARCTAAPPGRAAPRPRKAGRGFMGEPLLLDHNGGASPNPRRDTLGSISSSGPLPRRGAPPRCCVAAIGPYRTRLALAALASPPRVDAPQLQLGQAVQPALESQLFYWFAIQATSVYIGGGGAASSSCTDAHAGVARAKSRSVNVTPDILNPPVARPSRRPARRQRRQRRRRVAAAVASAARITEARAGGWRRRRSTFDNHRASSCVRSQAMHSSATSVRRAPPAQVQLAQLPHPVGQARSTASSVSLEQPFSGRAAEGRAEQRPAMAAPRSVDLPSSWAGRGLSSPAGTVGQAGQASTLQFQPPEAAEPAASARTLWSVEGPAQSDTERLARLPDSRRQSRPRSARPSAVAAESASAAARPAAAPNPPESVHRGRESMTGQGPEIRTGNRPAWADAAGARWAVRWTSGSAARWPNRVIEPSSRLTLVLLAAGEESVDPTPTSRRLSRRPRAGRDAAAAAGGGGAEAQAVEGVPPGRTDAAEAGGS